ncbi:hypothetical protein PSm6_41790 [Pseudomonas solani]|uniref:Uncharacterized protein n=1 Tax=Pseudomonas solani TaxID=2731552 RepID=A0ABM7LDS1_9PSED|nr:hypothetical protein PSm6_41790 [Pseudomonas solani]
MAIFTEAGASLANAPRLKARAARATRLLRQILFMVPLLAIRAVSPADGAAGAGCMPWNGRLALAPVVTRASPCRRCGGAAAALLVSTQGAADALLLQQQCTALYLLWNI